MSEILYVDFGKSDYVDKATILTEHFFNAMYNAGVRTYILPAYTHKYTVHDHVRRPGYHYM